MLCPNCQHPLPEDAYYCAQCGKNLNKRSSSWPKIILPLLALVALLGGGWYFYTSNTPPPIKQSPLSLSSNIKANDSATQRLLEPANNFMHTLKEKRIKDAYEEDTSEGFQDNTSLEKFQAFVKEIPLLTDYRDIQIKSHEINQGRGLVTLVLNPEQENIPVEFRLIQENSAWKILFMRVLFPEGTKVTGGKLDALSIISTVQEYLDTLQLKKVGQAYKKFLGKDLQKEVPLEGYRQFIGGYPAFTEHDSYNIREPYFEDKLGEVTIDLIKGDEITEVTYALQEENNEWKIVGMHVEKVSPISNNLEQNPSSYKTRELIDAIQAFLKALRQQKVDQAYSELTASHFREENSLPDFEDFVKKILPLSESESATFDKLMFNNNIATFEVSLYINETEAMPVEFDLIKEKGQWKILNLFVHPAKKMDQKTKSKTTQMVSTIEFPKVELGTKINSSGEIEAPQTSFEAGKEDLYVNIFIHNGKEGDQFEVMMRHVESGSNIPPVKANVLEDGDSMVNLVFSPPPKGWPKGNYQIRISTENKVYKTFVFKVE